MLLYLTTILFYLCIIEKLNTLYWILFFNLNLQSDKQSLFILTFKVP